MEKQERASSAAAELTEDGYDDFGRKRGAKPSNKSLKEAAALARLNATFGGRCAWRKVRLERGGASH